jgi:hypothetical protein
MEDLRYGDKVFHRNLKMFGTFEGVDTIDIDSAHVTFIDKYDSEEDYRRVSTNWLVKVIEYKVINDFQGKEKEVKKGDSLYLINSELYSRDFKLVCVLNSDNERLNCKEVL